MSEKSYPVVNDNSLSAVTRRGFLKLASIMGGLIAAGCIPDQLSKEIPGAPVGDRPLVAIGKSDNYERQHIKHSIQALLEWTGGAATIARFGSKIALKVNLTGGLNFNPHPGFSAPESYVTHPEIVRALGELLIDAGVKELYIVEALYDRESISIWGYEQMAKELGALIIDLNSSEPYTSIVNVPTGPGWFVYENFWFNPILREVDALVSIAKMKCHYHCGITLSMKNLIGLVPVKKYRLREEHWWRSAFHGTEKEAKTRLPKIILDFNRTIPVDFALIDGIMTAEGGESPRGSFHPIQPGIVAAGIYPVTVDAVATAVMGFDPLVEPPQTPFLRCDNYLSMARELGMGTNRLSEIDVVGAIVEEIKVPFMPAWEI